MAVNDKWKKNGNQRNKNKFITSMMRVPNFDSFFPHFSGHLVLVDHFLGQQVVASEHARLVGVLVVVAVLRLNGVRSEKDGGL